MSWVLIDHTADVGIKVQAPDLRELFREAALAMVAIMGAGTDSQESEVVIKATGYDREDLIVRWLEEIRFRIEVQDLRVAAITIQGLDDTHIRATITGGRAATPLETAIKAVTYHALAIREVDNHLETTIIFDT